jgi:hypothetical protein
MNQHRKAGQILVIILLVLSILSIFVLSMVTNAKKDTIEKIDNRKYEQFYSLGEQNLVNAQSLLGVKAYTLEDLQRIVTPEVGTCSTVTFDQVWGTTSGFQCQLKPQSYDSTTNQDKAQTTLYLADNPVLQLYELNSDSNLKINLFKGTNLYTGSLDLYWNSVNNYPTNWVVTVDYYVQSSDPNVPSYKSFKISDLDLAQAQNTIVNITSSTTPRVPYTLGQVTFSHGIRIDIDRILSVSSITPSSVVAFRIKPLIGIANSKLSIGINPSDPTSFPSQFRKITAIVNSATIVNNGEDSPTPVLNLEYPLTQPINPLFDYVLRAGYLDQH